ncbi:MAG: protein kinase [Gallionella sp.]|jgi:serine/threonine protein kinase
MSNSIIKPQHETLSINQDEPKTKERPPLERIGKYEIVRELGSGATSCVYLALDPFNNQQVAVKLFHPNPPRKSMRANVYRKLLQTEASLAGKLSHPHIVKMFDAVLSGELNYMVMEYVEGDTLEKYASVNRLLSPGMVAEIMYKCGNALEYAQRQGVIHRDIKPANILVQEGGNIKIADFGAAVIENQQMSQQLTQVPGVGSPAYMSPEQIQELPLTHQTDIYSLGVTFYKLLTGRLPFNSENNYSLLYQIINETAPPLKTLRYDIPEQLDTIVRRAMHKDLSQRYQTWGEFTRDLANFFGKVPHKQTEFFDTEKFEILRSLTFFKNVGDTELWEVLRINDWRRVPQGECILRENDQECAFFIIANGVVKVTRQGSELSRLHKGDCFGEMKRFPDFNYLRATSVFAETDVTLIEINLEVLAKASVECRFQFDDAFLYILLKRLDEAHTRISSLLHNQIIEI